MKLAKTALIAFLFMCSSAFAVHYDENHLWILKSHGPYKVKVYRIPGRDDSGDYVQVDIYNVANSGDRELKKTIVLPTPGYKGYVKDINFKTIENDRIAILFDIEMKAMEGVALSELFIVDSDGRYKKMVEAKYVDLFDDLPPSNNEIQSTR